MRRGGRETAAHHEGGVDPAGEAAISGLDRVAFVRFLITSHHEHARPERLQYAYSLVRAHLISISVRRSYRRRVELFTTRLHYLSADVRSASLAPPWHLRRCRARRIRSRCYV